MFLLFFYNESTNAAQNHLFTIEVCCREERPQDDSVTIVLNMLTWKTSTSHKGNTRIVTLLSLLH